MTDFAIHRRRVHSLGDQTISSSATLKQAAAALDVSSGNPQFTFSHKADETLSQFSRNLTTLAEECASIGEGLHDTAAAAERTEANNQALGNTLNRAV